ncbi:MAG: peptidoglycan-binding protein, partial [Alphaproteobacteria bacterium]
GMAKAETIVIERIEGIQAQLADLGNRLKGGDAPAAAQFASLQERLDTIAASISGADVAPAALAAIDRNFNQLMERIGSIEVAAGAGPAAPEELLSNLESIRTALAELPSRENLSVVDARIRSLVAKVDSMDIAGTGGETLQKVDTQLHGLAQIVTDLRDRPDPNSAETHRRLGQLIERIDHLGEKGTSVDLGGIETRLADILVRLDCLRDESVSGLAERLDNLSANLDSLPAGSADGGGEVANQLQAITARLESTESLSRADLVPIANRIGALESAVRGAGSNPGAPAVGLDEIRDRLDAISGRLDASDSGGGTAQQFAALLKRFENAPQSGAGMSLALEEKLEGLTHALASLDDLTALEDVADLRGDIATLRRELRSMPGESGGSDSAIVPILQDIAERLNKMPEAPPVTFRDLEDQMGRIVRLIESPETDHGALAQIDARLQDIQESLTAKPTGISGDAPAHAAVDGEDASQMVSIVTEIARSLSADISILKESAAATEENSRRAMDSVHGSLEAVVKRMAFLEGDGVNRSAAQASDGSGDPNYLSGQVAASASVAEESVTVAGSEEVASSEASVSMDAKAAAITASLATGENEGSNADPVGSAAISIEHPDTPIAAEDVLNSAVSNISLADDMRTDALGEALSNIDNSISLDGGSAELRDQSELAQAETPNTSLLGRLTPSQLLRRATGGRTESFSPDMIDNDAIPGTAGDLPLEPGTDALMSSSLDGAPSSATADMAGGTMEASSQAAEHDATAKDDADHLPGSNDFLMAARRAAQAAAAEAMEAERTNGIANDGSLLSRVVTGLNSHRYLVLGGALVLVIVLTTVLMAQRGMLPFGIMGGDTVQMSSAAGSDAEPIMMADMSDGNMPADNVLADDLLIVGADDGGEIVVAPEAMAKSPTMAEPVAAIDNSAVAGTPMQDAPGSPQMAASLAASTSGDGGSSAQIPAIILPVAGQSAAMAAAQTDALSVSRDGNGRITATLPTSQQKPTTVIAAKPDEATAFGDPQAPVHLQPSSRSTQAAQAKMAAEPARIVALPDIRQTTLAVGNRAPAKAIKFASPPVAIGPNRLRQNASEGDPVAMFEVAVRLAEGRGVAADSAASASWYQRAAESGLAPAQYRLGSIYEKGIGVEKNLRTAESWYRRAAVAGNAKAMHNLAVLYAEGAGGNPDLSAAAGWFQRAAELGVRDSQFNIAILHARGLGVPEDLGEAYKWFAIAAKSGDEQAAERRNTVASALRASDLNEAAAFVKAFRPSPSAPTANIVVRPIDNWQAASASGNNLKSPNTVLRTQQLLRTAGYKVGRPDGIFGPRTQRAISAFQRDAGLPVSGEIDPLLISALEARAI